MMERSSSNVHSSSDITNYDPETWPIAHTINNIGHGYSFSVTQTIQFSQRIANEQKKLDITVRTMEGFKQIWDRYIWPTPSHGSLNIPAPLCRE